LYGINSNTSAGHFIKLSHRKTKDKGKKIEVNLNTPTEDILTPFRELSQSGLGSLLKTRNKHIVPL